MIKKLTTGEYLKDYRTMTAQEREAYRKRVGEWLRTAGERLLALTDRPMAKAQNLMSMSARWMKEDCEAAHEGAVLLTALMAVAETWLPSQLWVKSAWRAVRQINSVLSEVKSEKFLDEPSGIAERKVKNEAGVAKEEPAEKTRKGTQAVAAESSPTDSGMDGDRIASEKTGRALSGESTGTQTEQEPTGTLTKQENAQGTGEVLIVPMRPKHIDQYVYLLPKGTQERAGAVRGLLRELDEAREKMRLLMEDAQAKPDARAAWARKATRIDATLKGIYKELDAEWEKLVKSGRVTVDALGNANVAPSPQNGEAQDTVAKLTSEQKARRRELRKWLIDLRRGKEGEAREKRIEQWKMNWKEYLTLEPLESALKDEKVVAAAEHFGVEINS